MRNSFNRIYSYIKKMYSLLFSIIFLFVVGCKANGSFIDPIKPEFETISFDVVEKKLLVEVKLPEHILKLISNWFDKKVKINGFDGDMIFKISNYAEEISLIDDGKRVDITLSFNLILSKPLLSKKQFIEGTVSAYGTLKGDFTIKEFETIIANTQTDLVIRLSKDLKSKI